MSNDGMMRCGLCGNEVAPRFMPKHLKGRNCKVAAFHQEMRDKDYLCLGSSPELFEFYRQVKVPEIEEPFEGRGVIWVPAWAHTPLSVLNKGNRGLSPVARGFTRVLSQDVLLQRAAMTLCRELRGEDLGRELLAFALEIVCGDCFGSGGLAKNAKTKTQLYLHSIGCPECHNTGRRQ